MRFMMLLKADKNTEAGVLPTEKDLTVMGKCNEELIELRQMFELEDFPEVPTSVADLEASLKASRGDQKAAPR